MTPYGWAVFASAAAGLVLLLLRLRTSRLKAHTAFVALPLCALFGIVTAKLVSVLAVRMEDLIEWQEWELLLDISPKEISFVGGAAGVCLGMRLAAAIGREDGGRVMDAFAPSGLVMICGLRLAEAFLGLWGAGALIEGGGFPAGTVFAVRNEWGDEYLAVYVLEAASAFVIAAVVWLMRTHRKAALFQGSVIALCLTQMFWENLRNQGMRWGFVRVEQVLCGGILFIILLRLCAGTRGGFWQRYRPAFLFAVCGFAFAGLEFARQKSATAFFSQYGQWILLADIAALGLIFIYAMKRVRFGYCAPASLKESAKGA